MPRRICTVEGCENLVNARGLCQSHQRRLELYGDPLVSIRGRAAPEERFWRRVDKSGDCWLWTGHESAAGYGRFQLAGRGGKYVGPHRFSYEMANGPVPDGMVVMHSCDNRLCVNPDHLSVGTHRDNTADMIAKGRKVTVVSNGTANGKSKLTPAQVRFIRASTLSQSATARLLGVDNTTVRGVLSGRTWSHII